MKLNKMAMSLFIISSLFFLLGCETKSQSLSEEQKEELTLAIDQFNNAFANSDVSTLASMITENYMHTNGTSKAIDKETWLNYLNKRNQQIKSGALVFNDYKMSQLKIEFHNTTAIVTGKVSSSFSKNDEIKENEFRVSNLWVYEKGTWKRAGFHDGKIK
ncbi:nuclear transport factor 2 family protein [Flagellimonas pacifica]|uniref:SnoaL-like domain-containing protein n=1 Tax=Flagellimonas pacifica TaxID=1247520 RepID=A0A285MTL4_9FLAO|nr:nuclear transport factor 2 family protein [Allomuricauda parva]SNZ00522.1 SnoaL-like domain-containing protein [Allomuricauda parva]